MPMSVEEQVRLLNMVEILEPLSEEEMEQVAIRAPDNYLEQGDILYTPHESSERLFILKKGRVQVYEIDEGGDEITLSVVEDGTIFGEMSLTGQSLQGVYVRALAPSTIASMRKEHLEDVIRKNPEVGLRLLQVLAEKLRASETRYASIVQKDVPARLATLILTLVESEGLVTEESYRIPTRYTHEQLGSMIGAKRVAVTRAFGALKENGAVEFQERHIIVKDLEALKEAAAS